jgi:hypothetical protein
MLYLLFVVVLTTSCTSKKLDEQVKAYQEAHNSGNVKKELSFMAEDIKYALVDEWKIEGKEDLRKLVEMDAVLHSHLIFTDVKVSNNKVTCSAEEQNDLLKLTGIDTLYYEFREFIFEKGLIKEVRAKLTEKSTKALRECGTSFAGWAAENRKEELTELQDKGLMTKDNVGEWLALMRAWREEMDKDEQQEESEKEVEKLDLLNVPPDSKIDSNSTTQR